MQTYLGYKLLHSLSQALEREKRNENIKDNMITVQQAII